MKTPLLFLLLVLSVVKAHASDIGQELAELFSARHAAALVPAKEGRIDDRDPFWGDRTHGMTFKPSDAFALESGSFETALKSAGIEHWTFGMQAPWTPGKRTFWLVLDPFGSPFLSLELSEDLPNLIRIKQVIGFAEGVAILGRTQHRYFRCELTSKDLVSFLQETVEKQSKTPFTPTPPTAAGDRDPSNKTPESTE